MAISRPSARDRFRPRQPEPGPRPQYREYASRLRPHGRNRVRALAPRLGRWLDIGFGNGAYMTTAAEFGFHAVGLDLRENCVEIMRNLGFEAHAVEFEKFKPAEPFDVISMADVLEHMPYPKPCRHARNLLRTDGLLFVSMPNSDSFLWKVLSDNNANPYWGELEHYHNFGRRRLYALLTECGFEPVRYGVSARYRACMEVIARKK